jgi:hypothetical protein
MSKREEFKEMEADHLSLLTQYGRHFVGIAASAVKLLEDDFLGKSQLSPEDKSVFLGIASESLRKHIELLDWSIQERQNFIHSMTDEERRE